MFRLKALVIVLVVGAPALVLANPQQIIQYSNSVPLGPTNSTHNLSIPKFDPALGDLTAVQVSINGHVEGAAKFESFNSSTRTVTMNLAAQIQLRDDNNQLITSTLPLVSLTASAGPYDSVFDFGGTSGHTFSQLSADAAAPMTVYTDATHLAAFTGQGSTLFPVIANGASTASGPGNVVYQFSTETSAWVSVAYVFTVIPEPASGLLAFVFGIAAIRRRR